ncbi:MAG: ATP-binding protein [Clostridia bacterium]|nr:ATP-binding protein [Clostridia bacterium]
MRRLKIRTRMTLWFLLSAVFINGLLFAALHAMTAAMLERTLERDLTLALEQVSAQIEREQGNLTYEDETPIAPGISYYVMEEGGSELFSRGVDITWFDAVPISEGNLTRISRGQETWLVLDSLSLTVEGEIVRVRTAASCMQNEQTLHIMRMVFFIALPILMLLSALIGSLVMGRCLRPIRRMIDGAQRITAGDLSGRLPASPAQDELGQLTHTLNRMLGALEDSIRRERRFVSDASHELRTPVTVVRACAEELLSGDPLPAFAQKPLQTILTECRRMQRLIEQMLTLARGQEGRIRLEKERFSVLDALESIEAVLAETAAASNIRIHLHVPEDMTIVADQSLFSQLMLNLTGNAVKYGRPNGRITLAAEEKGEEILLRVQDDGIGISAEDLPHIFDRFFRADAARDRSGTGLGLSIAQWIVQIHGGSIAVESTPGEGTLFSIRWPNPAEKAEA